MEMNEFYVRDNKSNRVNNKVGDLERRVSNLKEGVKNINKEIEELSKRMDVVEERINESIYDFVRLYRMEDQPLEFWSKVFTLASFVGAGVLFHLSNDPKFLYFSSLNKLYFRTFGSIVLMLGFYGSILTRKLDDLRYELIEDFKDLSGKDLEEMAVLQEERLYNR